MIALTIIIIHQEFADFTGHIMDGIITTRFTRIITGTIIIQFTGV